MKTFITALLAVLVLTSCSVYRSGQTPDDVYYSPARQDKSAAYVETNDGRDDGRRYNDTRTYNGYDDYATAEDRWLMMRVRNPYRWSYFDNYYSPYGSMYSPYGSFYSPYSYYDPYGGFGYNGWGGYGGFGYGIQPGITLGLGFGYYSPSYWNSYYNPYYPKVVVVNPKTDPAAYYRLRNFTLNSYNNRTYNTTNNPKITGPRTGNRAVQGYNNNNNSNNNTLKNSFRRVFAPGSDSRNREVYRSNDNYKMPSQDRPVRVYSPSNNNSNSTFSPRNSGGSSSSGSSSGSSGSRPSRR